MTMQEFAAEQSRMDLKGAHIQSGMAHETVKQQNIKLATAQQATADAEYDNMVSRMTHEQRDAHDARIVEDVRLTKKALAASERALVTGLPVDFVHTPLFDRRARQLMGAGFSEEYRQYYAAKVEEALKGLPDHERAAYLTGAEAQEMSEQILTQFMEEKGLDPDNEIGDGFLASVQSFNEANVPNSAQLLMKESRKLALTQVVKAVSSYPAELAAVRADPSKTAVSVKDQKWFITLQSMDSTTAADVLFNKKTGAFARMAVTSEGALGFQMIIEELADKLTLGGELMQEDVRFPGWLADAEAAVEQATKVEAQNADTSFNKAVDDGKQVMEKLSWTYTAKEMQGRIIGAYDPKAPSSEWKESILEKNPELEGVFDNVSDEEVPEVWATISRHMQAVRGEANSRSDALTKTVIQNFTPWDTPNGLTDLVSRLKRDAELATPAPTKDGEKPPTKDADVLLLFDAYLTGVATEGGLGVDAEGNTVMSSNAVMEFDSDSNYLLRNARNDLNNVQNEVLAELGPDHTPEEYQELYGAKVRQIETTLQDNILAWGRQQVQERGEFLRAVETLDVEWLKANDFQATVLLSPAHIARNAALDRSLTDKELEAISLKHKAFSSTTPVSYLKGLTAPEDIGEARMNTASWHAVSASLKTRTDALMVAGRDYEAAVDITSKVASRGAGLFQSDKKGWRAFDGEVPTYNHYVKRAGKAFENRYAVSVPFKDALTLAGSYDHANPAHRKGNWGALVVPGNDNWLKAATNYETQHTVRSRLSPAYGKHSFERTAERDWPYNSFRLNQHGDAVVDAGFRAYIQRDTAIGQNHLIDNQPPIIGIPFSGAPTEDNMGGILERAGITEENLRDMGRIWGYPDGLSFLKSQWKHPYYINKTAAEE